MHDWVYSFLFGGEYRALGTVMIFSAIMLWVYRLFLRKMANYFQTNTLVKFENWYERHLRSALSGKRPYVIIIGTFLYLLLHLVVLEHL